MCGLVIVLDSKIYLELALKCLGLAEYSFNNVETCCTRLEETDNPIMGPGAASCIRSMFLFV